MAYLKQWAPRAHNDLELRMPDVLPRNASGKSVAICTDAVLAAIKNPVDVAYLDPPYNAHKYVGNYHIWETLVRWDAPEVYGVACKRVDCKDRTSVFNSKPRAADGLHSVMQALRAKYIVVSFSNEGFFTKDGLVEILGRYGDVQITEHDTKRYVGAQIGIYNPQGEKVGTEGHLRNVEYLFVVTKG